MSRTAGRTRFPPLVWMYWPIFGIRSICDWTCRPNSRSTRSRSARIGSKSCARGIDDFSTAAQVRTLSWPEQRVEVRRGPLSHIARRHSVELCQRLDDAAHVGGLVAFAAIGHRRQKRAVGLGQEPIERYRAYGVTQPRRCLRKRDDARHRNVEAQIEARAREHGVAGKTVQHAAQNATAFFAKDRDCVVVRFAGVDDDRMIELEREAYLRPKHGLLHV